MEAAATESALIFGLPPIFALLPMIVFIVLSFSKKTHPIFNTLVAVLLAMIMTKTNLNTLGAMIYNQGLKQSMAMIGMIMIMGSGLGAVMEKAGVAENVVRFFVKTIGIKTENRAIITTMVSSCVLTAMLATLVGANAVITPVLIPLLASVGLTPACLGVLLQAAGMTGMYLGPYSADMMALLGYGPMSWGQYLIQVGLPICIPMWVGVFFTAKRINKKTQGNEKFDVTPMTQEEADAYKPTKKTVAATAAFLICLLGMILYSMITKQGTPFVMEIMLVTAMVTGLAGGLGVKQTCVLFAQGMGKLVYLFFMFLLANPYITLMTEAGGFSALAGYLTPLVSKLGIVGFALLACIIGVFGISGAAVVQMSLMAEMFLPFVQSFGITPGTWIMILLIGSEITNFAYPAGQTLGQMGLAHTSDVKSMLEMSYTCVIPISLIVCIARALICG